jgi:hypothetical protein
VVDVVESDDRASAIGLTNADFENKGWDRDEEDTHEIWDEPLKSIIIIHLRRISNQVSHTGATTHGCEQEGRSRAPLITTIFGFRRWRRQPFANFLEERRDSHVDVFRKKKPISNVKFPYKRVD